MSQTLSVLQLLVGLGVLYWGSEWLIRGSATMARALGVKALVIGLTVVAYGTSAPELAVSTEAALSHSQAIALGNVIGSCIANLSLILGLTALIRPPSIDKRIIRREVPVLLGSAIIVPVFLYDGVISHLEGGILIGCALIFTVATLVIASGDDLDAGDSAAMAAAEDAGASMGGRRSAKASPTRALLMSLAGLVLVTLGSELFVAGARSIALASGMSDRLLGLTVIAIGTALPELIASVTAATRGYGSLAVGSVIGANLLNVFLVLGIVAWLQPIHAGERMHGIDLGGLVAITLLAVVFLRGSRRVTRVEGAVLATAYLAFVVAAAVW